MAYQSSKLRGSSDYYDYYDNYPQLQSQASRLGLQMRNNRLARLGGAGGGGRAGGVGAAGTALYGGYSNQYGQYANSYGTDYDYGYSGSPAQSKSSYGSYSGGYNDCPGIPIALLLVTLLGVGVMGFILFTKIQAAGGRKKRDIRDRWTELLPELETLDLIILHGRGSLHFIFNYKHRLGQTFLCMEIINYCTNIQL